MASDRVHYPGPGCLVEFLQGNTPVLAVVLEEQGGRLRLYTQGRRETNLQSGRLLPWAGPTLRPDASRLAMEQAMESHRELREQLAATVDVGALWELVQGEVEKASSGWLASLVWAEAGVDHEAALGRALLESKVHFRFSPPEFEVFSKDIAEQRHAEIEAARIREALAGAGATFFKLLWDISAHKRPPLTEKEMPDEDLAVRLREMLLHRIADPEGDGDGLWKSLIKGLPDHPHMPLLLASAWKLVPEHYNFWLDRAGFDRGNTWAEAHAEECAGLAVAGQAALLERDVEKYAYISIDPEDALDRDDAFFVDALVDGGWRVNVALACPAIAWPFGSPLDKAVLRRASSVYLPEGDEHMLPPSIGWDLFGLDAGKERPALGVCMRFDAEGMPLEVIPRLCRVKVAANLFFSECEAILLQGEPGGPSESLFQVTDASAAHAKTLHSALALARKLQLRRIASGAVITERPEPEVRLQEDAGSLRVDITAGPEPFLTQTVVGEIMIAANASLATWAVQNGISLLFRTQDVGLPKEFAGIWNTPQDIARVVRALPPAGLEAQPKRHAGLGLDAYATVSSSLRRYVDLFNQGQVVSFLRSGVSRASAQEVVALLPLIAACQDATGQIQRFRPRYWKLLFFKQHGDKQWWDGIITEENEAFVSVALPWAQLVIRGRRKFFDDKIYSGLPVQVRLGKVNPLMNEIQILESREA